MLEPIIAEIGGIPPVVIQPYPLTLQDLARRHSGLSWPDSPTPATFEDTEFDGRWYALVEPTPEPTVAWGERAIEVDPVNVGGIWTQVWAVESITLVEAKQQLAQLAINIYWERMLAPPGITEFQNASRNGVTVLQGRATRFQTAINDVATRIQSATTIANAYAIYLELEALA